MPRPMSCAASAILLLGITVLTAYPASAISRVSASTQTCAALRQTINAQGAVIVTHPGTRQSGTLYDRYVRDSGYCNAGDIATDDWVPAKDGSCRLYNCQEYEPPFDN